MKESGALMPDQPYKTARFDHLDEHGDLVFVAGDTRYAVTVDDTLERAILESKQMRAEHVAPQPRPQSSLPISQIQSLIRAGAEPARVAERYGLSEPLVRRFSASVETEKQYAIEQFLAVAAPKESRAHSLAALIDRSLAAARVPSESVTWRATRRGLEPWRVTARFEVAGRAISAEWMWDMHDNTVLCVNGTAKKLLGDRSTAGTNTDQDTAVDDGLSIPLQLPGDSARSARIEQTVSAWNSNDSTAASVTTTTPATRMSTRPSSSPGTDDSATIRTDGTSAARTTQPRQTNPIIPTPVVAQPHTTPATVSGTVTASTAAPTKAPEPERTTTANQQQEAVIPKTKRRPGRSTVPSWDEILFGD